jgi:hypothetical protein
MHTKIAQDSPSEDSNGDNSPHENNLPNIYDYYYSPTTSQSSVISYTREEREKLFPPNLSQINDLNRNIAILSKPEDVVVHLPMSQQLASIKWYQD